MDLIVIPSMGRHKRQQTLATFERTFIVDSYKVVLAVPKNEVSKYETASYKGKRIKRETLKKIDIHGVPKEYSGISRTREYILTELARYHNARRVFMVDDDLSFCHRPDLEKADMPYINDDPYGMHCMVEQLTMWLEEGLVHVGLISRQANRKTGVEYQEPGRMMNAYAYDAKVIQKLIKTKQLKLGRIPVMEDFDLTLQLIRLGYPSRVSCQYAWTQTSNIDGGCSTYRTAEVQAEAAYKLAKLHKGFVEVVERKAKTWKNNLTARVDVRIAWKKAYEASIKNNREAA